MAPTSDSERPYRDAYYPQLLETARAAPDDIYILYDILAEAQARVARNPASKSRRVLVEVLPTFQELFEQLFPEPPDAQPGVGPFDSDADWPKVGVLGAMGYTVGAHDPGPERRRTILKGAFLGPLPNVHDMGYMATWGQDQSLARLLKIAWSIATFGNNRLRSLGGMDDHSVANWRADLAWLKEQFYDGIYSSSAWPPGIE